MRRLTYILGFVLILGGAGWSAVWLAYRLEVTERLEALEARMTEAGAVVEYAERRITGFPLTYAVSYEDLEVALTSPSEDGVSLGIVLGSPALTVDWSPLEPRVLRSSLEEALFIRVSGLSDISVSTPSEQLALPTLSPQIDFLFVGADLRLSAAEAMDQFEYALTYDTMTAETELGPVVSYSAQRQNGASSALYEDGVLTFENTIGSTASIFEFVVPGQGTQRSTGLAGTVTQTAELQVGPFIENLARIARAAETPSDLRWSDLRDLPADSFMRSEMLGQTIVAEQFDLNGDLIETGETTIGLLDGSLELSRKNIFAARMSLRDIAALLTATGLAEPVDLTLDELSLGFKIGQNRDQTVWSNQSFALRGVTMAPEGWDALDPRGVLERSPFSLALNTRLRVDPELFDVGEGFEFALTAGELSMLGAAVYATGTFAPDPREGLVLEGDLELINLINAAQQLIDAGFVPPPMNAQLPQMIEALSSPTEDPARRLSTVRVTETTVHINDIPMR
ncbi:MAG: DUF2125 domain-containing protein [Pseudomonadota bacterium]